MERETKKTSKPHHSSFIVDCPICSEKTFKIVQKIDHLPYFGEVLETFASCDKCRYKTSDILPLEKKDAPAKQKLVVNDEKELKIRLVKSKFCTIEIPEIKLKIEPGAGSEAYITNVEGLLQRIEYRVKGMEKIHPEKSKEFEKILETLEKMKNGKKKFVLKFNDRTGQSKIFKKE